LNAGELEILEASGAFMETNVAPIITKYWADDAFPFEVLPACAIPEDRPVLVIRVYGCRAKHAAYGFVQMEDGPC